MNLSSNAKLTKLQDHTTAGTTAVASDEVDMQGFEGVLFLTSFGTAAADNTVNAAQSSVSGGTFVDLEGTSVASGTSDEDVWLDIFRPIDRYVRLEAARGTSSTLESIWAVQYGPGKMKVSNVTSGTIIGELHESPAEGTA